MAAIADGQFREFYDAEYSRAVRALGLVVGDRDVAREAVDEALARAWNGLQRGKEIDSLAAWVWVVALNYARSRFRRASLERRARRRYPDRDRVVEAPVGDAVDVQRALERLGPRQREVVVLYYFADRPVDAIAAQLDIAPGTVKATLHHARETLAGLLAERTQEVP